MRTISVLAMILFSSLSMPALGQPPMKGDKDWNELEKVLDDVNQQWLCSGQYYKSKRQDCVDFRAKYWADQFFEIGQSGRVQNKAEMVASQSATAATAPDVVRGTGPNPQEFKLMAVYGNIALATDHTIFQNCGRERQSLRYVRSSRSPNVRKGKWDVETRRSCIGAHGRAIEHDLRARETDRNGICMGGSFL